MRVDSVISLSGGMDSTTLLLRSLANTRDAAAAGHVTAVSFDYGQKHIIELERAAELVAYIRSKGLGHLLSHHVIQLGGLPELLNSHLVAGGPEVPEGHYESENMRQTVVPNRNKIMASIVQAIALSISNSEGSEVRIGMGIHAGDHAVYPDCRAEFRDADFAAFQIGNWNTERVTIWTPYIDMDKAGILGDGLECCELLGLNFDAVYARTNTSYKPRGGHSDYKSASSVERIEAFIQLGRPDPVGYADETGPVDWEVAASHVKRVLAEGVK